ncbi:hypothetical protein IWX84_000166 [Flavobacterium sp. CG_9.10]|uniref:hypothetical protein n=1 Tax=Flavobacterium sp. CG_9.10 TaxID=2787729 RepID=UPI0018C93C68|nr:hypothetical protein [Flavobacterium sp. CG_9.10]MBG6109311.1 hypothetical protein [Flavobacterium sp. CG_9.10]
MNIKYNICTRIKSLITNTATMGTNELTKTDKIMQKIQLVKGEFTPFEASNIIMSLIDQKINFHQRQKIQKWEENHESNSDELNDRITQLENEKQAAKEFISNAINGKTKLKINGTLEITIVDNQ